MLDATIGLFLSLIVFRVKASGGCEPSEVVALDFIVVLNRREPHSVG
jgi:hypothetical protein